MVGERHGFFYFSPRKVCIGLKRLYVNRLPGVLLKGYLEGDEFERMCAQNI